MSESKSSANSILTDEESNRLYLDDPQKFLSSFGPSHLGEKDVAVDTVRSIFRIQVDATIRLIRGVKIKCTNYSLPYFGALYQQRGCNFAVFNNNINHCFNIPPERTPLEFQYLRDEWYFEIIRTCFGIANLSNTLLVLNCIIVCTLSHLELFYVPGNVKLATVEMIFHIMLIFLLGFGTAVGDMARVKIDMNNVKLAFGVLLFVGLGMVVLHSRLSAVHVHADKEIRTLVQSSLRAGRYSKIKSWLMDQVDLKCCGTLTYMDALRGNGMFPLWCCPKGVNNCTEKVCYKQACYPKIYSITKDQINLFSLQSLLCATFQIPPLLVYYMYLVALRYGSRGNIRLDLNAYPLIENFYTIAKGPLEDHLPIFLFQFERTSLKNADDDLILALLLHEINNKMNRVDKVQMYDPKFLFYALV